MTVGTNEEIALSLLSSRPTFDNSTRTLVRFLLAASSRREHLSSPRFDPRTLKGCSETRNADRSVRSETTELVLDDDDDDDDVDDDVLKSGSNEYKSSWAAVNTVVSDMVAVRSSNDFGVVDLEFPRPI